MLWETCFFKICFPFPISSVLRVDIRGQQPLTVSADAAPAEARDAAPAEARQLRYQEFANSIQMRRAQDAVREACNDRGLNCQLPETQVQQMLANWETEADYEERQRHGVRVSFCQVSFGRGWQLRLSLAINLLMCRKQLGYSVRFVVVLYKVDGNDLSTQAKTAIRKDYFETIQWLKHNCNHELASGSLVVYVASAPVFHSSKMKNLAHKCALLTPWQQGCTIPTPEAGEGWNLSEQCRKAMPLDPKSFAAQYDIRTPASFDPTIGAGNPRNHMLVNLDADNILPDGCWDNLITSLSKR